MTLPAKWVGAFLQPPELLDHWKSLGVNVLIACDLGVPARMTQAQYRAECRKRGLYYIQTPESDAAIEEMVADPFCAFIDPFGDEPDVNKTDTWYTGDAATVAMFQAEVAAALTVAKPIVTKVNKRKPLFVNFAGSKIMNALPWYGGQVQAPFVALMDPKTDVICQDTYPCNGGAPTTKISDVVKQVTTFWPGFTQWCYLECGDQKLGNGGRAPTAVEMEAQFLDVEPLVKGIMWFSHQIGSPNFDFTQSPNAYDNCTGDLLAKRTDITNRFLSSGGVGSATGSSVSQADFQAALARISALEAGMKNVVTGVTITRG